jgi:hypothetical protein
MLPRNRWTRHCAVKVEKFSVTSRPAIVNADTATSNRDLRNFGLLLGALFAMIFGFLLPLLHHRPIPWWPWTLAALLAAAALILPGSLYYVHAAWNALGKVLGWINTRLILGLLFYAVVTPMGLLMRLLRPSALRPGEASPQASYRVQSHEIARANFEKPF